MEVVDLNPSQLEAGSRPVAALAAMQALGTRQYISSMIASAPHTVAIDIVQAVRV